ncbi:Gas1 protein, putative [Ixodes scapularis]|uniref:Gas1 protein, putative n=1 Tax=Ixodes scapularis TaxID=6945 RepID=B7PF58_IXOSC|nr:Gas1 protein, putative [Ixodes scapularis]|eukprot:XP_002433830.1 Gas1 protein, putative [Ixodes scapularis]
MRSTNAQPDVIALQENHGDLAIQWYEKFTQPSIVHKSRGTTTVPPQLIMCRQSFVSLATTEEGFTYLLCDCGRDEYCRALRRRTSSCWWEQPSANHSFAQRGSSKPTCSGLTVECMDDPVCSLAWDYYRRFCHEVLDGSAPQCSTRCRNSVSILLRMERAHRALECECDGGALRTSCADEISRVRTKCFMLDDVDANSATSPAPSAGTGVLAMVGIMLSFGGL